MKEYVATAIFAGTGLVTLAAVGVAAKKASSRPPALLRGIGIVALVLAATYVTLASLLRTRQQVGLWAPGLATSVPTALSSAGTTALSVWVALWAADQNRVAKFIADEATIIRELDGALRLLERRSRWLRDFWLGSTSPVVGAGEVALNKFRLGEVSPTFGNHEFFGVSAIAHEVIESLFSGFPDRTVLDNTEALGDASKRLVALEMQTGLPMQPLLGDVEFLRVITSCLDTERSTRDIANIDSHQGDIRVRSLLKLQLLVVMATCYWHASQDAIKKDSVDTIIKSSMSSQGQWWQTIFNDLSERPPKVAVALRQRYGKSPLTGYEAIKEIPAEELRETDRLWRLFMLASSRRSDVLDAIRIHDPERARPRSFSQLNHMMFWQSVREASHIDDNIQ